MSTTRRTSPLIANMAERLTADTADIRHNLGFIPSVTGVASVMPALGTALVEIPVVAGQPYPIDIQEFDATGSTALQELVILRQGGG